MATLRIYFELLSKQMAVTAQGPLGYQLPTLRQEDSLDLEISILRQISTVKQPLFELVNLSAWSIRVTIGTAGSSLTTATLSTVDSSGTSLSGNLALNTAGINALSDSASVYFEIIATNGSYVYGKRFPAIIEKAIYTSGALVTPADDTALGRAESVRLFVQKEGAAGDGFILTAENGVQAFIYLDNDGRLQASPIA